MSNSNFQPQLFQHIYQILHVAIRFNTLYSSYKRLSHSILQTPYSFKETKKKIILYYLPFLLNLCNNHLSKTVLHVIRHIMQIRFVYLAFLFEMTILKFVKQKFVELCVIVCKYEHFIINEIYKVNPHNIVIHFGQIFSMFLFAIRIYFLSVYLSKYLYLRYH